MHKQLAAGEVKEVGLEHRLAGIKVAGVAVNNGEATGKAMDKVATANLDTISKITAMVIGTVGIHSITINLGAKISKLKR